MPSKRSRSSRRANRCNRHHCRRRRGRMRLSAESAFPTTIASGRVFFGSDAGYIYSLDAKTGCVYWSFHADSGTRTAPIISPVNGYTGQGTTKYALYFVDVLTRAYALDAQTGKLL